MNCNVPRKVGISLLWLALVSLPGGLLAAETAAPGGSSLRLLPAVHTSAAGKASLLDSCLAGKRVVAVGDHGIVLLSDDNGKSFRQAKSVPVRSALTGVSFADEKNGWAVGHWGVILATSDGGENWQLQRSDTSVDQPLFSVYFKDRNRGWAVGLWSLVLATNDGGKSWDRVKLPPPPGGGKGDRNLLRIIGTSKGTLLVAAEQGTVLRSADNGATWNFGSTGSKGSLWTGIALKDGSVLVGGLRGKMFRSTDDGRSWKEILSGTTSSITGFGEGADGVRAVGLDGVVLQSSDGGVSFTAKQREDRIPFTAVVANGGGHLVAFSKAGTVSDFPEEKKVGKSR